MTPPKPARRSLPAARKTRQQYAAATTAMALAILGESVNRDSVIRLMRGNPTEVLRTVERLSVELVHQGEVEGYHRGFWVGVGTATVLCALPGLAAGIAVGIWLGRHLIAG